MKNVKKSFQEISTKQSLTPFSNQQQMSIKGGGTQNTGLIVVATVLDGRQ